MIVWMLLTTCLQLSPMSTPNQRKQLISPTIQLSKSIKKCTLGGNILYLIEKCPNITHQTPKREPSSCCTDTRDDAWRDYVKSFCFHRVFSPFDRKSSKSHLKNFSKYVFLGNTSKMADSRSGFPTRDYFRCKKNWKM